MSKNIHDLVSNTEDAEERPIPRSNPPDKKDEAVLQIQKMKGV